MSFYARTGTDGDVKDIWDVTGVRAFPLYMDCRPGGNSYWEPKNGRSPFERLLHESGFATPEHPEPFVKLKLKPGQFHRRIIRPSVFEAKPFPGFPTLSSKDDIFVDRSWRQFENLLHLLRQICRTIEPVKSNMSAYGHDIRNLILLGSTEVEMHWAGVLKANSYVSPRKLWNTDDYIELLPVMKLNEFAVKFLAYPGLGDFTPFKDWAKPSSKSLKWYTAYNSIKHDLEFKFSQATLGHAFDAVAAVMVMLAAQFGSSFGQNGGLFETQVVSTPKWEIADCYYPGPTLKPMNYKFC